MGPWSTEGAGIPKKDAIANIAAMAKSKGLKGAFKVFYKDQLVADPEDLPETVNMADVKVSAVLDQA